jgi:ABC-type molybdenum transport system ATPase subunit/photorepair protein PhrA
MKNSINTNLLILDEVFDSSMDATAVCMLVHLLKEQSAGTNIFVISHKEDQLVDSFISVIKFVKIKSFSIIEKKT